MLYTIVGFFIPVENDYQANSIIEDIGNTLQDKNLIEGTTYTLAAIQEIDNIEEFGQDLLKFLEK